MAITVSKEAFEGLDALIGELIQQIWRLAATAHDLDPNRDDWSWHYDEGCLHFDVPSETGNVEYTYDPWAPSH